jgi:hypothetical protein
MREEQRIDRICNKLKEIWKSRPDERFGQLLINLGISKDNFQDWNREDDILEKILEQS